MPVLRHLGKLLRLAGWIAIVVAIAFLYIIPFVQAVRTNANHVNDVFIQNWFMDKFFSVNAIIRLLITFIPIGVAIWFGDYAYKLAGEREIELENRLIGFLKSYGRISLIELSTRLGLSPMDTERLLASIRGKRDIVFSISAGHVIMPGYERGRPVKEIEKITREIVTTECKHCGALVPVSSKTCPECGASMKR